MCSVSKDYGLTSLPNQGSSADATGSEGAVASEQQTLAETQQVLVTLAGGGEGASSAEVVEVNMYELLNNSVTFICKDKPSNPDLEAQTV